jgi:hypothetical protein
MHLTILLSAHYLVPLMSEELVDSGLEGHPMVEDLLSYEQFSQITSRRNQNSGRRQYSQGSGICALG